MKRKVIQLAHKTLVVSLPSKWVKKYEVKKGDELEVEERGQQIIFATGTRSSTERASIDASKISEDALRRWVLSSIHKTGYDEIEITYSNPKVPAIVQDTVKEMLIGFAVVEQGRNRCVIRVVAEEQEKEFDAMLRRAFLVTKGMGESMHDYIKEGKRGELKELLSLEKTNNQLTNFCERILNKKGYPDDRKRCFAYVVAWNLEKICDHYKDICAYLAENRKAKLGKDVIEMVKKANDFFGSYYELFYRFETGKLSELGKEKKEFSKKIEEMLGNRSTAETIVLCSLNELVTKTSDFSASFIALNS